MSLTYNIYEGDIKIFDLKEGDWIQLYYYSKPLKIVKAELEELEPGIAQTIRLTFEDGEASSFCSDGEVSGSTCRKYYNDIARTGNAVNFESWN